MANGRRCKQAKEQPQQEKACFHWGRSWYNLRGGSFTGTSSQSTFSAAVYPLQSSSLVFDHVVTARQQYNKDNDNEEVNMEGAESTSNPTQEILWMLWAPCPSGVVPVMEACTNLKFLQWKWAKRLQKLFVLFANGVFRAGWILGIWHVGSIFPLFCYTLTMLNKTSNITTVYKLHKITKSIICSL